MGYLYLGLFRHEHVDEWDIYIFLIVALCVLLCFDFLVWLDVGRIHLLIGRCQYVKKEFDKKSHLIVHFYYFQLLLIGS